MRLHSLRLLLVGTIFLFAADALPTTNQITGFETLSEELEQQAIESQERSRASNSTPPFSARNATGAPTAQPLRWQFTFAPSAGRGRTWWDTVAPAVVNSSLPSVVPSRYSWMPIAPVRVPSKGPVAAAAANATIAAIMPTPMRATNKTTRLGSPPSEQEEQEIESVVQVGLRGSEASLIQQKLHEHEMAPTNGLTPLQLGLIIGGSVLGLSSLVAVGFLAYRRFTRTPEGHTRLV